MESFANALHMIRECEPDPLPIRSERSKEMRKLWNAIPDDVWFRIFDDICQRKQRSLCLDNIYAVKLSQVCRRLNELFRCQYVVSVASASNFFFPKGKLEV